MPYYCANNTNPYCANCGGGNGNCGNNGCGNNNCGCNNNGCGNNGCNNGCGNNGCGCNNGCGSGQWPGRPMFLPAIVNAVNTGTQTGTAGTPLVYTYTPVQIGTGITSNAGGGTFMINEPGTYMVSYNTQATNTSADQTIGVQLTNGGTPIPGSATAAVNATANGPVTLSASTPVIVYPNSTVTLALTPTTTGDTFSNTSLTINRIGPAVMCNSCNACNPCNYCSSCNQEPPVTPPVQVPPVPVY